jgi:hypothetical protein
MNRVDKQRMAQRRRSAEQQAAATSARPDPPPAPPTDSRESVEQPRKFPKPRLPHGSYLSARWDAEEQLWTGTLTVAHGGELVPFRRTSRTLFTLMDHLDRAYRAWQKTQEQK